MIKAIYEAKDNKYLYLEVSGHAEYDESGRDLICASVSSIVFGFMNALDALNEDIEIKQLTTSINITTSSIKIKKFILRFKTHKFT